MYVETGCFDPNIMTEGTVGATTTAAEDGFSQTVSHNSFEENLRLSMEELSYQQQQQQQHHHHPTHDHDVAAAATAMEFELRQQLAINNSHLMDNSYTVHEMQDTNMDNFHYHNHQDQHQIDISNGFDCNSNYQPTPDLLNLFNLPGCSASSFIPNSSISFSNPTQQPNSLNFLGEVPTATDNSSGAASVLYDSLFQLNQLPPQPPLFRDMFQSLPHGYNMPGSRMNGNSLFGTAGIDEREGINGGVYQDDGGHEFENNGVLEFSRGMSTCIGRAKDGETKHFATERHRRQHLNEKYKALRNLVPNPTKTDRASVVGDAIEYIKELLRTVNELKLLVDKKRCGRERSKRHKTEADCGTNGDVESCNMKPHGGDQADQSYNGSLRSSWLQRKSKDTEVDVRIIDDEVTIKLVQRKNNCLLLVSKVLDDLQLDLHHVAGGHIGDFFSFLFNTKIYEGSSVYASAIANKLIEGVDKQCAAIQPTSSY